MQTNGIYIGRHRPDPLFVGYYGGDPALAGNYKPRHLRRWLRRFAYRKAG